LTTSCVRERDLDGQQVPYIVRLERGVINRGLYEIAALHDGDHPSPFSDEVGWNGKLVMTFGGGCNVGYRMRTATAGVLVHDALSRGYDVASNSLLVNDTNCNPVTAAETALMTKERAIEAYGLVVHTIGWGGSGGAIMQYTITHAHPGILDGLLPQTRYADSVTNAGPPDCALLQRYLATPAGASLTAAQRQAIGGHRNFSTCLAWVPSFSDRISATAGCPAVIPVADRYDPVTNPTGVCCALVDHLVTQIGRDPATGFARATFANDGVQYGLQALQDGVIDVEQFLSLNEGMGGFSGDGNPQRARSIGDAVGIEALFANGLATSGLGGLASTPMIDLRRYTDDIIDIHTPFWSVTMHERLVRDGVDPRLHNRWIYSRADNRVPQALDAMDGWLAGWRPSRPTPPRARRPRRRPGTGPTRPPPAAGRARPPTRSPISASATARAASPTPGTCAPWPAHRSRAT
jgi:hypothetical protein